MERLIFEILKEQIALMQASAKVLNESYQRVQAFFDPENVSQELSIEQKESCEALTARFSRLCDFLFQRVFRTLDEIELQNEGTGLDRLNRMEKRGLIQSAEAWRAYRHLRNQIAQEYLMERAIALLQDALRFTPEVLTTVQNIENYVKAKSYLNTSDSKAF